VTYHPLGLAAQDGPCLINPVVRFGGLLRLFPSRHLSSSPRAVHRQDTPINLLETRRSPTTVPQALVVAIEGKFSDADGLRACCKASCTCTATVDNHKPIYESIRVIL